MLSWTGFIGSWMSSTKCHVLLNNQMEKLNSDLIYYKCGYRCLISFCLLNFDIACFCHLSIHKSAWKKTVTIYSQPLFPNLLWIMCSPSLAIFYLLSAHWLRVLMRMPLFCAAHYDREKKCFTSKGEPVVRCAPEILLLLFCHILFICFVCLQHFFAPLGLNPSVR